MAVVYRHIRLDTGKPFYIGIGVSKMRAYAKYSRNNHWRNIVAKTDYDVEILFDDLTHEQAQEKEKELIALYGRSEFGGLLCNQTDGGEFEKGMVWSEESRKRMSESQKKSPKRKELIKKIADERRGKKIPWQDKMAKARIGGKRSEEFKRKISEKNKARDKSVFERIAAKHRGMKRTEESKQRMSDAKMKKKYIGNFVSNNPMEQKVIYEQGRETAKRAAYRGIIETQPINFWGVN